MKLGESLKEIVRKQEQEAALKRKKIDEEREKIRAKVRAGREFLIESIKTEIIDSIQDGKVPEYKLRDTEHRGWFNRCRARYGYEQEDADLYASLVMWLVDEDLQLKVTKESEMIPRYPEAAEHWLVISVEPLSN